MANAAALDTGLLIADTSGAWLQNMAANFLDPDMDDYVRCGQVMMTSRRQNSS